MSNERTRGPPNLKVHEGLSASDTDDRDGPGPTNYMILTVQEDCHARVRCHDQ